MNNHKINPNQNSGSQVLIGLVSLTIMFIITSALIHLGWNLLMGPYPTLAIDFKQACGASLLFIVIGNGIGGRQ